MFHTNYKPRKFKELDYNTQISKISDFIAFSSPHLIKAR